MNMKSLRCNTFRCERRSGVRRADRPDSRAWSRRPAAQQIPLGVPRAGAVSWVWHRLRGMALDKGLTCSRSIPNIAFGTQCGSFGMAARSGWSKLGFDGFGGTAKSNEAVTSPTVWSRHWLRLGTGTPNLLRSSFNCEVWSRTVLHLSGPRLYGVRARSIVLRGNQNSVRRRMTCRRRGQHYIPPGVTRAIGG